MTVVATTTATADRPAPARARWARAGQVLRGVRFRIVGVYALVLALATGAGLLVERRILVQRLESRVDARLADVLADVEQRTPEPGPGAPVHEVLRGALGGRVAGDEQALVSIAGDTAVATRVGQEFPAGAMRDLVRTVAARRLPARGSLAASGADIRWAAVPVRQVGRVVGAVIVAERPARAQRDVDDAVKTFGLVAVTLLVLATTAAWAVAGGVLRRVRQVTLAARDIGESDLSRRVPVEGADEIAELAATCNRMLDRVESALTAQRSFLNDAGHELRTPITIVRGHLELLDSVPDEREETLAIVTDELDRMGRMVDDLLLLAKAERPGFLRLDEVDLGGFLEEVHHKAAALAPRDWRLAAGTSARFLADRQRLTQALINLADNAVHHSGPGDPIVIGGEAGDGEVRLWVRDSGPGIPVEDQHRIFDRFARRAGGQHRQGVGLGLAIVRVIAEAHGGRASVVSVPGGGATFALTIPLRSTRSST